MQAKADSPLRKLGHTDLLITPVGLGTYAIGGGNWGWGWGPQDDADSLAAIRRAVELGINWIDTAPVYGLGKAEELVGRALRECAKKPYVFTKCTLTWNERGEIDHVMKADSIEREVEASLRRLRVD